MSDDLMPVLSEQLSVINLTDSELEMEELDPITELNSIQKTTQIIEIIDSEEMDLNSYVNVITNTNPIQGTMEVEEANITIDGRKKNNR